MAYRVSAVKDVYYPELTMKKRALRPYFRVFINSVLLLLILPAIVLLFGLVGRWVVILVLFGIALYLNLFLLHFKYRTFLG